MNGPITQYATLRRRPGLDVELFRTYWRDIHGPLCCELPGLERYVQHHLEHDHGAWWPNIPGVDRELEAAEQLDGAPEVIFASAADRQAWLNAAAPVQDDEINAFGTMAHQLVLPGDARTYVDHAIDYHIREADDLKLLVMIAARTDELGDVLAGQVAPRFSASPHVLKLRLSMLQPVAMDDWVPAGVDTLAPIEYGAIVEIAWADYRAARRFYASELFEQSAQLLGSHASRINAFRCVASYTFFDAGRPTLAGLRGVSGARTIRAIGATNVEPDALEPGISQIQSGEA